MEQLTRRQLLGKTLVAAAAGALATKAVQAAPGGSYTPPPIWYRKVQHEYDVANIDGPGYAT